MQDTCILHQKHFHTRAHCDVISDEFITDKVQNQGGGQYSFSSMFKFTFRNVLIIAMPSCVNLELVIFIVPFNRLNGFHNTST